MARRGRPKTGNLGMPRVFKLRLTDMEFRKLKYLAEKTGRKMSDLVREGIDLVFNKYSFS